MNIPQSKTCKIHRRLPDGGILIFVTGQQEVRILCKKLCNAFPLDRVDAYRTRKAEESANKRQKRANKPDKEVKLKDTPKVNLDTYGAHFLGQFS
jgi:ATP-dependent RNA helicase DHX37/DHR1